MSSKNDHTDKVLLQKIAQGDHDSFSLLYQRWHSIAYHNISIFLKDEDECLDVLQEVFIHIWQKRDALVNVENFKSFLYISCRNRVLNAIRQNKNQTQHYLEYSNFRESHSPDASQEVHRKDMETLINHQMEQMPNKMREIFVMSRYDNLSHDLVISYKRTPK